MKEKNDRLGLGREMRRFGCQWIGDFSVTHRFRVEHGRKRQATESAHRVPQELPPRTGRNFEWGRCRMGNSADIEKLVQIEHRQRELAQRLRFQELAGQVYFMSPRAAGRS